MSQSLHSASAPFAGVPAVSTLLQHLGSTAMSGPEGRSVFRSPQQLRLHPALREVGWAGEIGELNKSLQPTNRSVTEPVLITTSGIVLTGIGRWRSAQLNGGQQLNCIEYPLSDEGALQFIISHHQPQRGWNAFIRIRLALTLEPYLQQRALENMRAGGKYKRWANLPEAQRIDAREEIARFAGPGACARNVSNVKTIMQFAHPRLIDALTDGKLRINRAVSWCKLPKAEQVEQFIRYSEERATTKVIRRSITRPVDEKSRPDVATLLDVIQRQEMRQPGSISIRFGRDGRTVILVVRDLLPAPNSQRKLALT